MYIFQKGLGFICHPDPIFFTEEEQSQLHEVDDNLFFDPTKRMILKNGEIVFEDIVESEKNSESGRGARKHHK